MVPGICPFCDRFRQAVRDYEVLPSPFRFFCEEVKRSLKKMKGEDMEEALTRLAKQLDLVGSPKVTRHILEKLLSRKEIPHDLKMFCEVGLD